MKGVVIRISKKELENSLRERAAYHHTRFDEKSKELPKLEEAVKTLTPQRKTMPLKSLAYSADQDGFIDGVEKDIRIHLAKAKRFAFIADHLVDEDYELTLGDAEQLELIPGAY